MTHDVLHKKASESFWPVMMKQSRLAVQRLLDEPENFATEMKRSVLVIDRSGGGAHRSFLLYKDGGIYDFVCRVRVRGVVSRR